jgi:tetratricopeptide (TPR) repeat protein
MQRLVRWQPAALLFVAAAAVAQVRTPTPSGPAANPPEGQVTITAPRDQSLPELRSDEYTRCMGMVGAGTIDYVQSVQCESQLTREKHIVVDACVNAKGESSASRIVQACTEALDRNIFEGNARFFLFASRAGGFLAQGDKQHALDDYNEAVKLAPRNAFVYYNRGLYYETQSDNDAALRDFEAAIGIDSKLVPALRQRARLYQARGNLSGARDEYSKAIDLDPKMAALWSERGYVALRQKDYENAMKDEAEAIRIDPALARAYYLRGAAAAFGGLGQPGEAINDIKTAVGLDQSLAGYVKTQGKTASLTLPPF